MFVCYSLLFICRHHRRIHPYVWHCRETMNVVSRRRRSRPLRTTVPQNILVHARIQYSHICFFFLSFFLSRWLRIQPHEHFVDCICLRCRAVGSASTQSEQIHQANVRSLKMMVSSPIGYTYSFSSIRFYYYYLSNDGSVAVHYMFCAFCKCFICSFMSSCVHLMLASLPSIMVFTALLLTAIQMVSERFRFHPKHTHSLTRPAEAENLCH